MLFYSKLYLDNVFHCWIVALTQPGQPVSAAAAFFLSFLL